VLQAQLKALEQKKKDLGLGSGPLRGQSEKDKKRKKVGGGGGRASRLFSHLLHDPDTRLAGGHTHV
jgi:hypothetical protein